MEAELTLLKDELRAVQVVYDDVTMYYGGNMEPGGEGGVQGESRLRLLSQKSRWKPGLSFHPLNDYAISEG